MSKTYWNHEGLYEATAKKLNDLVPFSDTVENPRKNKQLERFRKASNCYYDLYNNGLCNKARSFAKIFGIAPRQYWMSYHQTYLPSLYEHVEQVMNGIIELAAIEQGIDLVVNPDHIKKSETE